MGQLRDFWRSFEFVPLFLRTQVRMSGYRSLKHVLGESNLERKCRLLFGLALVLWIGGAFWWVSRIGEGLVIDVTNGKGRNLANTALFDLHWHRWTDEESRSGENEKHLSRHELEVQRTFREIRRDLSKDLLPSLSYTILSTEIPEDLMSEEQTVFQPASEEELAILNQLKVRQREQLRELLQKPQLSEGPEVTPTKIDPLAVAALPPSLVEIEPIFETRISTKLNKYLYYQPVYWKQDCTRCHDSSFAKYAMAAGESPATTSDSPFPFVVVKVAMPYAETGNAIASTRAWLIAAAVVTVALAMVALWAIVRYVVVKPLNHLRDVSDAVTRGHLDQRAEIQTGDEFEDLATSFNKMLRHLVDTQAEIRNMNKDLDAKVDELAQLNMRLYDMNRMKSDFLANMSHELRTPLNSIIGFSDVLAGIESLTDKQRRYVQNIQKSGRQLLEMINDILDLAKLEAGQAELRLSEFQLDRIILAQCDMVRSLTDEKNLDLVVNADADLPPMFQDQGKIQQVLTNLLSNAIKFTPEGGRITVGAKSTPQGLIELTVADTGVGIAEADREVIFEKFRQGSVVLGRDSHTREYSGTGLGLSIVRELCKLMGGDVSVTSELGRGSIFKVAIPWMAPPGTKSPNSLQSRIEEMSQPQASEFMTETAVAAS